MKIKELVEIFGDDIELSRGYNNDDECSGNNINKQGNLVGFLSDDGELTEYNEVCYAKRKYERCEAIKEQNNF